MQLDPTFTVLLPVHRGPELLPFAAASVLGQTRGDFELFIIADGAPPATIACAERLAAQDARVQVRAHPKGECRGEAWRHQALLEARGQYVCQLGDDDLWLDSHLDQMEGLLRQADFGNLLHVTVKPDGGVKPLPGSLADPQVREELLGGRGNIASPTCVGYRLTAYRALPEGWTGPPPGERSDLHMWCKFLRHPGLRVASRFAVTAICLPDSLRQDMTIEQRLEETRHYAQRARDPLWRAEFAATSLALAGEGLMRQIAAERAARRKAVAAKLEALEAALRQEQARARRAESRAAFMERSRFWRLRQRLVRLLGRV
jgi:hypothetical protein